MDRSRGKLFRKYLVVFLLLVGGLLTVASAVDLYFSYRENQRALVQVEREKAFAAAETIQNFIQGIEHHVRSTTRAIADDPSVAAPRRRDTAYRDTLASALTEQRELDFLRLLRNVPAVTELRYIDVAGKEQIRVSRLALDAIGSRADFSDSPAYKGARSGKTYFSPVYFRNESEPFMTMAVPADASAFEVITAEVSLRAMWDVVSRIKVGSVGFAYVVDAQGKLIAHPDLRQVLKGRDLSALPQVRAALADRAAAGDDDTMVSATTGLAGGEVLSAHAPIVTTGWVVFIEQPLAEAFAPLQATILRGVLILGLGLLTAILASVLLARGMVAPIRKLRDGAARIGAGDLAHRIDVRTGDELEALGEEFNRTAARLEESHRDLENKVAARTDELSRSVAELQALGEVGRGGQLDARSADGARPRSSRRPCRSRTRTPGRSTSMTRPPRSSCRTRTTASATTWSTRCAIRTSGSATRWWGGARPSGVRCRSRTSSGTSITASTSSCAPADSAR